MIHVHVILSFRVGVIVCNNISVETVLKVTSKNHHRRHYYQSYHLLNVPKHQHSYQQWCNNCKIRRRVLSYQVFVNNKYGLLSSLFVDILTYLTTFFLPAATKLRQGYVFTGVCDSVHRGERGLYQGDPPGQRPPDRDPLDRDPPGQRSPVW